MEKTVTQQKQVSTKKLPAGKTILLAEDDEFSILLIASICRKNDIKLVTADNGQIAFDMAMKQHFDLILTDINMPVFSGFDFINKLRSTPEIADLPTIAVTASVMPDTVVQMKEAGFDEILFKPFRDTEFVDKVRPYLNKPT